MEVFAEGGEVDGGGGGAFIITRVPLLDKWDSIYLTSADLFQ